MSKVLKKSLSVMLAIVLVLCALPISGITVNAAEMWWFPLTSYASIGDPFGCTCSIHKGNHGGQDIPAYSSSVIRASKSGTVVAVFTGCSGSHYSTSCKCGSSYGNYVKIKHDDGWYSLYAHMSSVRVSNGQRVSQGQSLGNVGTTGDSTGNHLHFEIRNSSDVRVNPMNYVSTSNPSPTEPAKEISIPDGYKCQIRSALRDDLYIDIDNTVDYVGANAAIWSGYADGSSSNQVFQFIHVKNGWYKIKSMYSGLVLDVKNGLTYSGTNVWEYTDNGSDAQLFKAYDAGNGYYYLKSKIGCYLDVESGNSANGTNVQVYSFNGSDAQKWKLVQVSYVGTRVTIPDGQVWSIRAAGDNSKGLDINNSKGNDYNGANLQLWECSGNANQTFKIIHIGSGWYKIQAMHSGQVLDVAGSNSEPGANVIQYPYHDSNNSNQIFRFLDAGDGYYYIQSQLGCYLDLADGNTKNGSNVRMWQFNGSKAEKWKLVPAHQGQWTVTKKATCKNTGVKTFKCYSCSYTETVKIPIDSNAHSYETANVVRATTSQNGQITQKCACGKIGSTSTIYRIDSISLSKSSYTYDGKEKKPTVTVKDVNGNNIDSKYYTVKYTSNKNVGTATVTVTFKGNYSGTLKKTFKINPKGTSISKLEAKSKGFKATWKKQATQTTGYEIQYSTSSSFSSGTTKSVKVTKNSTVSKTVSSLKGSKKYYVRVRTYKTVSGKNYYSSWSASKSVTTKK